METLKAFIFGVTLAIAVGPIAILIINRGLTIGLKIGLMCGLGAALADFTYGLVAFTIGSVLVGFLKLNAHYFELLTSAILLAFGLWMLHGSLKTSDGSSKSELAAERKNSFSYLLSTYLLTVVNPLTVVAFVGFSGQLVSPVTSVGHVFILGLSIFTGSIVVQFALAYFGATLGKLLQNPQIIRFLNIGSSICVMLFGMAGML
ncbi:LysE family translocator [Pontibacter anaerobius]|uniref:LysE family transporter n=1 Tax=Pontibacter anaerobius TaxID=2993940 RepID=A0ABT3RCN1_9BACT|nr:LysE family transporter [Pontibacter anaerobius]MCX2739276.1 LysE family transporter [Pontibacter anaerobius]